MAHGLPLPIHSFIHSTNDLASTRFLSLVSSSGFNSSLKAVTLIFPRDKDSVREALLRLRVSHSQRGHGQPGPSPPTRGQVRAPAVAEPIPQRPRVPDPAGGAARGAEEAGWGAAPRPQPYARPAPARPRASRPRRPRLTRVLATLPLWVMFLLCFSLAIRIRCLATMARAPGNALDSHLQGCPPREPPDRAELVPPAPGAAGGKARPPSPGHPAPQPPTSWLQREARARTEVIFHLRKPSPTSSPSFRSPQLPNQRSPEPGAAARPLRTRRPERSAPSGSGRGSPGESGSSGRTRRGPGFRRPRALCAHSGRGLPGPGPTEALGKGLGRLRFEPGSRSLPGTAARWPRAGLEAAARGLQKTS